MNMAKAPAKKSRPCIECAGTMSLKSKWETLEYKGQTTKVRTKGWWCDTCEEGVLDAEALKASEKALLVLKAEVDGLLPPDRVVVIRKRLGLSQRKTKLEAPELDSPTGLLALSLCAVA